MRRFMAFFATMTLPLSGLHGQPCAGVDSLARGLRATTKWYLTDADYADTRAAQGIPQIDTATISFVSDSLSCARAFQAWRIVAPSVPLSPSPSVYLVSFGSFFMARILPDGPDDAEPDAIFVLYDSQMNVIFRFGFLDSGG